MPCRIVLGERTQRLFIVGAVIQLRMRVHKCTHRIHQLLDSCRRRRAKRFAVVRLYKTNKPLGFARCIRSAQPSAYKEERQHAQNEASRASPRRWRRFGSHGVSVSHLCAARWEARAIAMTRPLSRPDGRLMGISNVMIHRPPSGARDFYRGAAQTMTATAL